LIFPPELLTDTLHPFCCKFKVIVKWCDDSCGDAAIYVSGTLFSD